MGNRDEKGRFIKGNTERVGRTGDGKYQIMNKRKSELGVELVAAVHSLLRTIPELKKIKQDKNTSALMKFFATAGIEGDSKVIFWGIEKLLGKAKQETESEIKVSHSQRIRRTDGTVVEYSLGVPDGDGEESGQGQDGGESASDA
jgi:hypothetical protein